MVEGVEGFSPWALCEREPKCFTFNSCTRSVGHGCLNTDGHLPHSYFMLLTASLTPFAWFFWGVGLLHSCIILISAVNLNDFYINSVVGFTDLFATVKSKHLTLSLWSFIMTPNRTLHSDCLFVSHSRCFSLKQCHQGFVECLLIGQC